MFSNYCCLVSAVSESLWPHGLQHARLACPSLSPGVCSNLYSLKQWCHPTTSSFVISFSCCLPFFQASGSFPMSRLFTSGGQNIEASASASSKYSGLISFRIDWFDLFAVQGILKSLLQYHSWKARAQPFLWPNPHIHTWLLEKPALTRQIFVSKVMSLFFNMLSRFVIAFLPRSKCLNFTAAVTIWSDFRTQENKFCHYVHCFPIYFPWSDWC